MRLVINGLPRCAGYMVKVVRADLASTPSSLSLLRAAF